MPTVAAPRDLRWGISVEFAEFARRHLRGLNVAAVDGALEASVCCALAGHRFDRWGYGRVRAYKAATSEGLGARAARTLPREKAAVSQERGSGSIK